MATIRFSPVVVGASGKAGDAVFASWKGRAYIRKRVIPANPKSAAQTTVRESMARCVALWRSLASQVKTVLDTYATAYTISGYNWYTKNNRKDEETNDALAITPPNTVIDKVATLLLTDSGGGTCAVSWTGGTVGANYYIYIVSRRVQTGEIVNAWSVEDEDTTLVSALSCNVTLEASKEFSVSVVVEENTTHLFSESVGDQIVMGA